MHIQTSFEHSTKILTLYVTGSFTLETCKRFENAYITFSLPIEGYYVDLWNTTHVDSTALSELLKLRNHAQENNAQCTLYVAPNSNVLATLKHSKLDQVINLSLEKLE